MRLWRRSGVLVQVKGKIAWASAGVGLFLLFATSVLWTERQDTGYEGADGLQLNSWPGHSVDDVSRQLFPADPIIDTPYGEAPNRGLIFIHVILIVYMFLGINAVCDVYFAGSLEVMVGAWDIKPDVAGATFMAAGGSAPELFTSLIGALIAENDVGFSTIVGSAVFNVLFVIGLCGYVSKIPIQLTWWPLFRDCTYYILGLSLLAFCAADWSIEVWEAAILFLSYIIYCVLMYFNGRLEALVKRAVLRRGSGAKSSQVAPVPEASGGGAAAEAGGTADAAGGEADLREVSQGEEAPGPPKHHIGRAEQPLEGGRGPAAGGDGSGRRWATRGAGEREAVRRARGPEGGR
eukprot:CAMPEP_0179135790 /NCGR_PEP_ID=MMETSP0796-20121207/64670_1 /TAXON_ID=73915 /ORGANISM="Pyrodinium bahamense, Strain pbaha01" /LENGTH=348 /DNA_ID=CAMNT_0020834829 /DNA_START=67 /DNA_END=1110 /DNA_ORIENTATION=+